MPKIRLLWYSLYMGSLFIFFLNFYLFMIVTQRERQREADNSEVHSSWLSRESPETQRSDCSQWWQLNNVPLDWLSVLPVSPFPAPPLLFLGVTFQNKLPGDPWVAQRFGACLWPRARSCRPGIESQVGLPVHGACFSLCLFSASLSLCDYHK